MTEEPRIRLNAKQTAKGLWSFDATVEYHEETIKVSDEKDAAVVTDVTLGQKLLQQVNSAIKAFKDDGKKLVTDE